MKKLTWNEFQQWFAAYRNGVQTKETSIVEDCINYASSFNVMGIQLKDLLPEAWQAYKQNYNN